MGFDSSLEGVVHCFTKDRVLTDIFEVAGDETDSVIESGQPDLDCLQTVSVLLYLEPV